MGKIGRNYRGIQTIDTDSLYQLNQQDQVSLKKFVKDLLSDNIDQVQNSQMKWNYQYVKPDFRQLLSDAFGEIKQKILSLKNQLKSPNQTASKLSYYLCSNIDTNKSKYIVKAIHNIILKTRELMKTNSLSSDKFQISQKDFTTFLSRVQKVVKDIQSEQTIGRSQSQHQKIIQSLNQSDKFLHQQIQKVKLKSQQLKLMYNDIYSTNKDPEIDKLNKKFKNQINLLQDQILTSYKENKLLQNHIDQLNLKLNEKDKEYQTLMYQIHGTDDWTKNPQFNVIKLRETKILLQKRIEHLEQQIKRYLSKIEKMQNDLMIAQNQKKNAVMQYLKIFQNPPREYLQYFNGHILNYSNRDYLKWFVQNIEKNVKRRIRSTKPLYRFDFKNKESFHTYIDNIPFIVLIVKLWNGQIIAGYSKPAFVPKSNVEFQEGYMFGLKNKKVFRVKKEPTRRHNKANPKPITYDECFLIWGNSDIRIKFGSTQLYSNFATLNGSGSYEDYGNEDATVKDLLLFDERQTELTDYELFGIEFEDN